MRPPTQRREITRYLEAFDFSGLFTDPSIGWDWPEAGASLKIPFQTAFLTLISVAEKRGVRILQVPPDADGQIPDSGQRRAIEKAVRPHAGEHLLIFTDSAKTRQIWQWNQRHPGKPTTFREITWQRGRTNELLLQKLASIAFRLDEEEGLDITGVVRRLSDTLDRDRVTKRFYDQFKKAKDAFHALVEGISAEDIQSHYTSLMLNRIMFCYFLQRKGFLDGDQNYLHTRLETVREQIGEGQFHSFYRSFLRRLFHEGLGAPPATRESHFATLIGNIPYLNGGIFEEHPIEKDHPAIAIPDEAFEWVFAFFDQYDWHLDERPLAEGNEINPEILGYVFEKFTNQKEMGAYYTKEDITEYISKNCIIPYLVNKIADKIPGDLWNRLAEDPDRYIYHAVRHGAGESMEVWEASLPENIRCGLRPETLHQEVQAEGPVTTLELRKDWNTPAPSSHGLPTEIWRETIARHQRFHDLRAKLRAGEIHQINDFITYNLDIRQFAQDLVDQADPSLLLAFFKALRKVSVLDPTCGSGAFLFAALEILQPLYLGCLERMRAFVTDWESRAEKHPNWERDFQAVLDHADSHPNEAYYIHKTIIVHNLYGVDIMEEAVEICKLRLFLKLAAQLEAGQPVEPLPDIDFNIRAGNTLVGYATRDEIQRAFTEEQGHGAAKQGLLLGIEHETDEFDRLMEQAEDANRAFQRFHQLQEDPVTVPADFRAAKNSLNQTLHDLREELDRFLAKEYNPNNVKTEKTFKKWRDGHQPFHWFVEFYGIMNAGGFDVIIGNPPYLESREISYIIKGFSSANTNAIHAMCMERSVNILSGKGTMSMIVPLSLVSTQRMEVIQKTFSSERNVWYSNFSWRPGKLFDTVNRALTIFVLSEKSNETAIYTTNYQKWNSENRSDLFENISHIKVEGLVESWIPKYGSDCENMLFEKLNLSDEKLSMIFGNSANKVFYRTTGGLYWKIFTDFPPKFTLNGEVCQSSRETSLGVRDKSWTKPSVAILSSNLFWWWYSISSNVRDLNPFDIYNFPLPKSILQDQRLFSKGKD